MQERSHKKGEVYQKDVKHWLRSAGFLAHVADFFGDAYDASKKACTIGDVRFDFSLKLAKGELVRHVLYGECKYRDERRGTVDGDFKEFLKRVYEAILNADSDDADSAVFVFVSTLPPEGWRLYLRNRRKYCLDDLTWPPGETPDEEVVSRVAKNAHVLVLSAEIIAR